MPFIPLFYFTLQSRMKLDTRFSTRDSSIRTIKVSEHSFGSLWVRVICHTMARERLQLTGWNLASEKYTDKKFSLTDKIWRFRSFHGNMNDWIQP